MRRSLVGARAKQEPVVIARASSLVRDDVTYALFVTAVAEAVRRQSLRRLSDHMAELEASARSVDESELEIME